VITRLLATCTLATCLTVTAAVTTSALAAEPSTPPTPKTHDRWPSFSPDGQFVAFERSRGRAMDIYVVGVDGSGLHRVTNAPPGTLSMSPAWLSPEHIIYTTTSISADYPDGSLFEVSSAGSDDHLIGPAGARARSLSPDGKSLLLTTRNWEVAKLDLPSRTIAILSHPPAGTWDTEAAWSPDGTQIAFGCNFSSTEKVGRSDICAMKADGTDRHVLVHRSDASEWVTWSPDGKRIAFQADRNDYSEGSIVVADVQSGQAEVISTKTGYTLNETPAWSPDGEWIALQVKTADGYRIALMHPDGSAFHRLT